jgi:hypothetical protein
LDKKKQLRKIYKYRWLGSQVPHLDHLSITSCRDVVIGCYGGHTQSGANKNEDGALVWAAKDRSWEFALLLDAHHTAESAELIMRMIELETREILALLYLPVQTAFQKLQYYLISRFSSPAFRARCKYVEGETACLISVRKDRFLWWLAIGDCAVYLLHPDLARMGQFALNQRNFFEWIGKANTFELPVPSLTSGVRELRKGPNYIVMLTDGFLETKGGFYRESRNIYKDFTFWNQDMEASVRLALNRVQTEQGVDSATAIAWRYVSDLPGLSPSRAPRDY